MNHGSCGGASTDQVPALVTAPLWRRASQSPVLPGVDHTAAVKPRSLNDRIAGEWLDDCLKQRYYLKGTLLVSTLRLRVQRRALRP